MGHDHAKLAVQIQGGDHVLDKGQVALGLGRDAEAKTAPGIVLGYLAAPVIQREGRIGDHPVEKAQLAAVDQLGIADGVALEDVGRDPV